MLRFRSYFLFQRIYCFCSMMISHINNQFKITMNTHFAISEQNHNQLLVQQMRHLTFSSHQPAIKRMHSLRKVETSHPTHIPEIHSLPFQLYPERTKTEISRQQLVERLLDSRRQNAESMRAERIRKQQSLTQSCTFKPAINAESKRIAEKEGRQEKETFQRLYECGLSRMKSLQECTKSSANIDKQNCTFHPNIGDKQKANADLAPIYERFYQILAEKRETMRALQQKQKEAQIKDRPQVSEKTNEIIERKTSFKKNVLERLFDHIKDKNNNLEKLAEKREQQITKQCTFHPAVAFCPNASVEGDFLERQERQAMKLQQKLRCIEQQQKLSFIPQINKLSTLLVEAERQGETVSDRLSRLHAQPIAERQAQIQKIEEVIYRECTFQPEINIISKTLVGAPHSHKCNCHPKEEQYHFKPKINQKSRQMAENHQSKPKNAVSPVEIARKEQEYKAMKECTFKPKTLGDGYRSANQKTTLDSIPGAASYKVRVEKVKAKRKEEEQIKSRLFELEKRYEQRDHTVAQPFNLSKGEPKLVKLKESAEEQFKKAHPFRPEIVSKLR